MSLIAIDNGEVMVGDTILPGIFESIEVEDDTQVDQVEIEGKDKKSNQRIAYNPTLIKVNLKLITDEVSTAIEKLRAIRKIYRPSKSIKTPQVYTIVCDEAFAHDIDTVTFASFRSRATNLDNTIFVNLEFEESIPIVLSIQERPVSGSTTTYTVVKGDTLSQIAAKFKTTIQAIATANNITDVNLIYVGQKLVIPSPSSGASATVSPSTTQVNDSRSWTSDDISMARDDDAP